MKLKILKIFLGLLIIISIIWLIKSLYIDTHNDLINPLNPDLIDTDIFSIESQKDTVLQGQKGTLILIKANTFTDCQGNNINGRITIKLKEVLSNRDIALSGLTTLSNKRILESGGMLYLNAYQQNRSLCISDSKSIGIIMRNETGNDEMKLFRGRIINNSVNWENPAPIISNPEFSIDYEGTYDPDAMTLEQATRAGFINSDTTVFPKRFFSKQIYDSVLAVYQLNRQLGDEIYTIFETSELGWVNIDRFINELRTEKINLKVVVDNAQSFSIPFVRLIFLDKKIALKGYYLSDREFGFGKSNSTEVNLPIGDKVILVVTSQKDGKPFIGFQEFEIKQNQTINLTLKESTIDKIKELIDNKI